MRAAQLLTLAMTASIFWGCSGGKVAKVYHAKTGELLAAVPYSTAEECKTAIKARREFTDYDRCVKTLTDEAFIRKELAVLGTEVKWTAKEMPRWMSKRMVAKQQAIEDEFYKTKCECLVRYGYLGMREIADSNGGVGKRTCSDHFKVACEAQ